MPIEVPNFVHAVEIKLIARVNMEGCSSRGGGASITKGTRGLRASWLRDLNDINLLIKI